MPVGSSSAVLQRATAHQTKSQLNTSEKIHNGPSQLVVQEATVTWPPSTPVRPKGAPPTSVSIFCRVYRLQDINTSAETWTCRFSLYANTHKKDPSCVGPTSIIAQTCEVHVRSSHIRRHMQWIDHYYIKDQSPALFDKAGQSDYQGDPYYKLAPRPGKDGKATGTHSVVAIWNT